MADNPIQTKRKTIFCGCGSFYMIATAGSGNDSSGLFSVRSTLPISSNLIVVYHFRQK